VGIRWARPPAGPMTAATLNETNGAGKSLARALGLFSIALGAAELIAPRAMSRLVGMGSRRRALRLLQSVGLREIGSGLGILARPGMRSVTSRVVGDALDAAVLFSALRTRGARRKRALVALGVVVGVAALDIYCSRRLG
jgi:hypothetical protein